MKTMISELLSFAKNLLIAVASIAALVLVLVFAVHPSDVSALGAMLDVTIRNYDAVIAIVAMSIVTSRIYDRTCR